MSIIEWILLFITSKIVINIFSILFILMLIVPPSWKIFKLSPIKDWGNKKNEEKKERNFNL